MIERLTWFTAVDVDTVTQPEEIYLVNRPCHSQTSEEIGVSCWNAVAHPAGSHEPPWHTFRRCEQFRCPPSTSHCGRRQCSDLLNRHQIGSDCPSQWSRPDPRLPYRARRREHRPLRRTSTYAAHIPQESS